MNGGGRGGERTKCGSFCQMTFSLLKLIERIKLGRTS